jgi:hypothetical protein
VNLFLLEPSIEKIEGLPSKLTPLRSNAFFGMRRRGAKSLYVDFGIQVGNESAHLIRIIL